MPIYEYYCPDNRKIYQFFAKTIAKGQTIPKCPDNPKFRMVKRVSRFAAVTKRKATAEASNAEASGEAPQGAKTDFDSGPEPDDARMESAMSAMENEFSEVDENDPKAMGRMMRRMAELTGERIDGEMEEVVRKLEEGADPDELDEKLGGGGAQGGPTRDPNLYDYD